MFTVTTNTATFHYNDYSTALGMYYTFVGQAIISKSTTESYFDFELNDFVLIETTVVNGKIDKHYSAFETL